MKSKIEDLLADLLRKYPSDTKELPSRRFAAMVKSDPELEESLAEYTLDPLYAEDVRDGREPPFRKPS